MPRTIYRFPDHKDPAAEKEYVFDLRAKTNALTPRAREDHLEADETISSFEVTAPLGITISKTPTEDNGAITVWLSGGQAGSEYLIRVKYLTSKGRTDYASGIVTVRLT
jgi:hypothetical protein